MQRLLKRHKYLSYKPERISARQRTYEPDASAFRLIQPPAGYPRRGSPPVSKFRPPLKCADQHVNPQFLAARDDAIFLLKLSHDVCYEQAFMSSPRAPGAQPPA